MAHKQIDINQYTHEEHAYITNLLLEIQGNHVPMAVVDYKGFVDDLQLGKVIDTSPFDRRFGVRDLRHVEIYGFPVIVYNSAALNKLAVEAAMSARGRVEK